MQKSKEVNSLFLWFDVNAQRMLKKENSLPTTLLVSVRALLYL